MAPERGKKSPSTVAAECGADEILINCHDSKSLEPSTVASSKFNNFLDRVIQTKYPISNSSPFSQGLYSRQHQYQSSKTPQYPVTRQIIYDGSPCCFNHMVYIVVQRFLFVLTMITTF
jgi:hypothetical protein